MDALSEFYARTDAVGVTVALVLLAMSVSAWVVIVWKSLVLRRALRDSERALAAFWDASSWEQGRARLEAMDRERVVLAVRHEPPAGTLQAQADLASQLTRRLRDALQASLATLQFGQVLLASIGATSPFVGLFGTVWGIYQALAAIGAAGAFTIDRVSGPVGEALVMTAAGLAVAIPAVLAYNLFGKWVGACEARLEGFAHDLREIELATRQAGQAR
jgi:biopolymer transport protein ExbB